MAMTDQISSGTREAVRAALIESPEVAAADLHKRFGRHLDPGDFAMMVSHTRDQVRAVLAAREKEQERAAKLASLAKEIASEVHECPGTTFEELKRLHADVAITDLAQAIASVKRDHGIEAVVSGGATAYFPAGAGISSESDVSDILRRLVLSVERMEKRLAAVEATVTKLAGGRGR